MRKLLSSLVIAFVVVGVAATTALAGEVAGNGKGTAGPEHANSICVFSGLNDDPDAPLVLDEELAPNGPGGTSQSYGQDVKIAGSELANVFNPGDACRGGSNFARG